MGLKSQYQVGMKQRQKRKKKRDKLAAKGLKTSDYFYGKFSLRAGKE